MVTIGDVAKHLGISRSTVSYALSGKRPISPDMKNRIDKAVEELGYWPSSAGRALATSKSNIIALLTPMAENTTPSVAMQFVNGVAQASRELGYDTLLVTGAEGFAGVERITRSNSIDGLIVLDVEEGDVRLETLSKTETPAVLVGQTFSNAPIDQVDLDWFTAGEILIEHLTSLGHTKILILEVPEATFDMQMTYAIRFRAGTQSAAQHAGAELIRVPTTTNFGLNLQTIIEALTVNPGVTGVVIQHEAAVAALVSAAHQLDLRIPQDLSTVDISLDVMDQSFVLPMSGVTNPSARITRTAVDLLVERIQGLAPTPRTKILPAIFKDLGTTGPPRPSASSRK